MANSKFWRTMAVLAVCGLFYVGHGLHSGGDVPAPSLTSPVYADGGVASVVPGNYGYSFIATALEEGRGISIWKLQHTNQTVQHVGYFPMKTQATPAPVRER